MPKKNVKRVVLRRKLRSKKPAKVSTALKSYVHRALSRNEETKVVSLSYTLTGFNSSVTAPNDYLNILPALVQGTGSNNRIGNAIRPVKMVVRGYVIYNTAASNVIDARMIGARLMMFQDKATRSYSNSIYNFNLIDEGDGTSGQFTGETIQYVRPHNTDQFTWYCDRKFPMLKPHGYTDNTTPTYTNSITAFNSTMFRPFTITLGASKLPSKLIYDSTDDLNYPVNWAPKIALGYCSLLGKPADTTTTQLSMQFEATLYYKDA